MNMNKINNMRLHLKFINKYQKQMKNIQICMKELQIVTFNQATMNSQVIIIIKLTSPFWKKQAGPIKK